MAIDDANWPTVLQNEAIPLGDAISQVLSLIVKPFRVSAALIRGNDGTQTAVFGCVIYQGEASLTQVPIDAAAVAIICYEDLSTEQLTEAYALSRRVKSLPKEIRDHHPPGERHGTPTLIVARRSELNLEKISAEIEQLNLTMPSHYWPDAVAILELGVINYSAKTLTAEKAADLFLPAEEVATRNPPPSMWVQKIIRAAGAKTFHKVASLVIARLAIFEFGAKLPNYQELLRGMPTHGMATATYQFNLAGVLVPMTREQAIAGALPREVFEIYGGSKKLGSIQYRPWQDGGVFVMHGKFPIEPFLIFLHGVVNGLNEKHLRSFAGDNERASFVLPVSYEQFLMTLKIFEQRSKNITVKKQEAKWLVKKLDEDGSASPFVARLMIGVLGMRDSALTGVADRAKFDKLYEPLLSGLRNARQSEGDIQKLWSEHSAKVQSGEVVKVDRHSVQITEHIDRALRKELESFLNTAVRAIKTHLQDLTAHLGTDIGFLFQKESTFQAGLVRLRVTDPVLANYLAETRNWTEPLLLVRNNLEHGNVEPPKVNYLIDRQPIVVEEPQFEGSAITQFTSDALDRICCMVEEVLMYCLLNKLPETLLVTEIPLAQRRVEAPERFQLTIAPGGEPPWTLLAHRRRFSEV